MKPVVLLCSVGGSHQPIVRAIRQIRPDRVIFVCSQDDPETGHKGSYTAITGVGNILKSKRELTAPDLPNIPTQTGLADTAWEILQVPSDNLSQCYQLVYHQIKALEDGDHKIIIDYTGGTKTMSAALVLLAVDHNLALNLVIGTRSDHIRVNDGSEYSLPLDIQAMRDQRQLLQAAALWENRAYQQAAQLAQRIPVNEQNRVALQTLTQLSKAFAAWDRFDHAGAHAILDGYRARLMKYFGDPIKIIACLARPDDADNRLKNQAWKLLDLWNNLERRQQSGAYDDAMARLYRLLEWTAQWVIAAEKGYQTADLPRDKIPDSIELSRNDKGCYQAGLIASWKIAAWIGLPDIKQFMQNEFNTLFNHIKLRNQSILAHGYQPITEQQFTPVYEWAQQGFLPLLKTLVARPAGGVKVAPNRFQLPQAYPSELLELKS